MEQNSQQGTVNQEIPRKTILPLTLTLAVLDILQDYFLLDIVEDRQRIRATVDILSRFAETPNWKYEIENHLKLMRRFFEEEKSLLQVAVELKVPVDELERYCSGSTDVFLRISEEELDRDMSMYERVRIGLKKREARRLAYERLRTIEELKGEFWAIRMILGVSKKHLGELQDAANKYGKVQPGIAAIKPSGQVKHELNRIMCEALAQVKKRPLTIFEPTQGVGEATHLYARYGVVVSVERAHESYAKAKASHRHHAADLMVYLKEGWAIEELIAHTEREQFIRVLMPSHARTANTVIPELQQAEWHFDIIDTDPFDQYYVYQMIEDVFPLLADMSLIFISVNPSPRYGRSKEIAQLHGERDTPEFREQLWRFDCWRHMWRAYDFGLALIPVLVHKCWTANEQSGIDRLYFAVVRATREQRNAITYEYLGEKTLKEQKISPLRSYQKGTVPVLYFNSDIREEEPTDIPQTEVLIQRVHEILAAFSM